MVDPTILPGGSPRPVQPGGPGAPGTSGSGADAQRDVQFRALLDRLQSQAENLQQKSEHLERPDDLAGAVEDARRSLGDALSIGEELLEALRAERHIPQTEQEG